MPSIIVMETMIISVVTGTRGMPGRRRAGRGLSGASGRMPKASGGPDRTSLSGRFLLLRAMPRLVPTMLFSSRLEGTGTAVETSAPTRRRLLRPSPLEASTGPEQGGSAR